MIFVFILTTFASAWCIMYGDPEKEMTYVACLTINAAFLTFMAMGYLV